MRKKVVIAGGGGFIGGHLAKRMIELECEVICIDIKPLSEWWQLHEESTNIVADLSLKESCDRYLEGIDEVYNLASDMGGMGFIENNKALCMLNVLINTHLLMAAKDHGIKKYFYASSACVYPQHLQESTDVIPLKEDSVYPAMPEDGYGWEKLFGERMCRHFHEDFGLEVRIARFHNVYGPHGEWQGGREKAPAAICRKVIQAIQNETYEIEIWGDGEQVRSFMYIDDCIEGIYRLMSSNFSEPLNVGNNELVTINALVDVLENKLKVTFKRNYKLDAPLGVRGRNSDNQLINSELGWEPSCKIEIGLKRLYEWISSKSVK